jgi:hypothetical protein
VASVPVVAAVASMPAVGAMRGGVAVMAAVFGMGSNKPFDPVGLLRVLGISGLCRRLRRVLATSVRMRLSRSHS